MIVSQGVTTPKGKDEGFAGRKEILRCWLVPNSYYCLSIREGLHWKVLLDQKIVVWILCGEQFDSVHMSTKAEQILLVAEGLRIAIDARHYCFSDIPLR